MTDKKQKAGPTSAKGKTSARFAPLFYVFGVVFLSLGAAWLMSLMTTVDSEVMKLLRGTLRGLTGKACIIFPFLVMWLGAALVVHAYHGVSGRSVLLAFLLYLSALAFITMITFVTGNGNLMAYIPQANLHKGVAQPSSIAAYMQRLFIWGRDGQTQLCGGGAISILVAYPVYKIFGVIGGIVFLCVLLIVLLLAFFHVHVGEIYRKMSDKMEQKRVAGDEKRAARMQEAKQRAEERPPKLNVMEPITGQHVQIETTLETQQTNPIYDTNMYAQTSFDPPMQPEYQVADHTALYDEPFVLHPQPTEPRQKSSPYTQKQRKTEQPAPEQQPSDQQYQCQESDSAAQQDPFAELEPDEPSMNSPVQTQTQETDLDVYADAPVDDLPPWEAEPDAPADQEDQELSDWQKQLQKKKEELKTSENERPAKVVYTDPAVKLTGKHIPINPSSTIDHPDTRMDGTPKQAPKQIRMDLQPPYTPPPISFLNAGSAWENRADTTDEDQKRATQIERTLSTFNIPVQVREITHGPAITRFAIKLAEGIKVRQVLGVLDNISLEMGSNNLRVESPIPGTSYIGIEVPNRTVSMVTLREVLDSEEMHANPSPLVVAVGKDIAGKPILCDLSKMPHLLIAGATGSGKSVCINSIVCSLLYRASPSQVRMIMVDPKQVELQVYNGIPHLLTPVVSDPKKAASALNWVVTTMLERYGKFSAKNVRNLEGYNKKVEGTDEVLPYIVVIIDEMADLMDTCRKDVEESIRRLAALARAAGIHMVLATQRPSVDVITGVIKNNIPSRIAFTVSSGTDSRTIIDTYGAEKLMGKGDMLYQPTGVSKPTRVQGCFVSDDEVMQITDNIRARYITEYDPNIQEHLEQQDEPAENPMDDDGGIEPSDNQFTDLLQQAIRMAVEDGQSSISMLQRRLRVGYARAGRLIDEMAKRGIISESEGSKPRKTLITREQYAEMMRDENS